MRTLPVTIFGLLFGFCAFAHPGSGVFVDSRGDVYVSDITRGLLKFARDGKVTVVLKEGGHWLAADTGGAFAAMDFQQSVHWPRWFKHRNPPGGPALISDGGSPLVIQDGNLYYVCNDEQMIPGGLELGRLAGDGQLTLVAPGMRKLVDGLGGIKGLAAAPDGSLYAATPGAVLKVKPDGTFRIVKQPVAVPDCDRDVPPNTPREQEAFLAGLAVSRGGAIYLASTGCRAVLRLDADGRVTTVLKAEAPWSPTAVAPQGDDLYVVEWTNPHNERHDYRPRVRIAGRDGKARVLGTVTE